MKIKLTILMLFLLFPLSAHTGYAADTVFVFNPEAKVSKITKVRTELENYLKSQGINANVYIFATPEDFDNSAKRLQPAGAIVASYYYTMMKSKYLWNAVLSGHKDGEKFYNKILVALKSVTAPSQLVNKSLAAVSLGSSSAYIDALLPSGLSAETVRIVSVSKDVDAIMALGFEQVQAAMS